MISFRMLLISPSSDIEVVQFILFEQLREAARKSCSLNGQAIKA